jgi:hypothetical protein
MIGLLALALVLPMTACGDKGGETGQTIADSFLGKLDGINIEALKQKAASADETIRDEVSKLIEELTDKKNDATSVLKDLAESKVEDLPVLKAKAAGLVETVTNLYDTIKKKLGM